MKKMYKARIFEVTKESPDCDHGDFKFIFNDYTAWEDIDEETLAALRSWVWNQNNEYKYSDRKLMLIVESEYNVKRAMAEYVEKAKVDNAKRLDREAKYEARKEKLRIAREARKLEKARLMLKLAEDQKLDKAQAP